MPEYILKFSKINASEIGGKNASLGEQGVNSLGIYVKAEIPSNVIQAEEFAQFLVEKGIDSISFNPYALLKGIENICKAEKKLTISVA